MSPPGDQPSPGSDKLAPTKQAQLANGTMPESEGTAPQLSTTTTDEGVSESGKPAEAETAQEAPLAIESAPEEPPARMSYTFISDVADADTIFSPRRTCWSCFVDRIFESGSRKPTTDVFCQSETWPRRSRTRGSHRKWCKACESIKARGVCCAEEKVYGFVVYQASSEIAHSRAG